MLGFGRNTMRPIVQIKSAERRNTMGQSFDMDGTGVALDLGKLQLVLARAVGDARNELEREINTIRDEMDAAFTARVTRAELSNEQRNKQEYLGLCHANTHREWMLRSATAYADAIEAYFHVVEARKRGITRLVDGEKVITLPERDDK
jgi:hypothetical protein